MAAGAVGKALLSKMETLCSKKEYNRKQILEKLSKAGCEGAEAAEIVSKLVENKYIDEARYARAYVRDKALINGWGDAKIRYMLAAEGIAASDVDAAFAELKDSDTDAEAREKKVLKMLQTKANSLKPAQKDEAQRYQNRLKLVKFALSRGYSYEYINPLIDQLEF